MAIVNPSNFLPGGNEHEGKVFDTIGYEKALKETGYTAESAEQWWKEHPDGVGYTHHSSIELDDNTGKITIKAPEWFLESETYNQYFDDDVLTGLGRLYAQNKDAKLQMADGTEKTVKEIIESWNNDLPKLVKAQESYEKMKKGVGEKFGEEAANNWTLGTYQLAGTSAYSGRDDDYLVIPNSILNNPNWSFLNDLEGLDKETGYITKKDFGEGYYHLDALRDLYSESPTSISKLKKDVTRAIQNFEGSDMTEYAKLIAFNNFLSGEAAEGASNTPKGDLLNKVTIDAHAFYEAFYRATAATANNLVNNLGSLALAPFSVVDWIGGKTEGYQSKFIIDEMVGITGDIIGDNLIPGAETVAEFLENEKNRRGDIYALTDSTASLIYNLAYMGTYTVETVLQSVAKTRLLINGVTLGITGTSVARGIPKVTESIQRMGMLGATTTAADGTKVPLWTTRAAEAVKANSAMTSGGVSQPVANLLTGMGGYSTWDKINLIGSLNPAELINGAFLYNQYIGQVGEDLAIIGGAGKAGAEGYANAYEEMLKRNASLWMTQGKWGDIKTTAEKMAYFKYLQPRFEAIYNTGNALLQTAAKVVTVLNGYAKYMPSVYYVSQVLIGTALSESDSIRRLMQGSDSNEQRDILWGMIGRTALGWTIGMVVGRVVNKVFSGDFDQAVESANLGATEKIAKGVTAVRDRVDQFHMLVHGGKDWVDSISNPVKKSVVKFNQSLAKSQEYMAKAADMVRAEGGTEIAARAATKTAIDQMRANQNAIDLMQNPEWQVASWHTDAYPAYNNASNVFTGLTNDVSKMLTDLGLNIGVKPTAIIGGVATNADLPQDVVNYMARALQRASYLRDDFDVSNVLVPIGQSIANMQSQYKIVDPRLIKERDIAEKVMAEFEGKYPKALVDLIKNKWVPAAQNAAYQLNQSIIGTGYYLRSQEEGWRKSGMWGQNNELWFPLQRVTDAQKDFEEAARNPMSIIKSGAIKRRSTDPKHLAPGSDEMTDFVHPMTTWKMHEFQQAIQLSINNWVHVNMTNPFVKNVTKLDGSQVGAAVAYDNLKPHYEKSVLRSLNATKQKLDESGLVNDMVDKQKMETRLKHAKKAVADAKETWENIPNIEVNITNAARSRTIDTLPESAVDDYLDRLGAPFEGEKVDIRKWLNSKVPGFDILDWGLLGREHTNELFPGGLYMEPGKFREAKIYTMSVDDLIKLSRIDDPEIPSGTSHGISKHENLKGAHGVIPLYPRLVFDSDSGTYNRDGFILGLRWYGGGDSLANWKAYLEELKNDPNIKNVPVAVYNDVADPIQAIYDDQLSMMGLNNIVEALDEAIATGKNPKLSARDIGLAMFEPGWDRSSIRKRIRHSIPASGGKNVSHISDKALDKLLDEAENYDWENDPELKSRNESLSAVVERELGYLPTDITEEVKQAFAEKGSVPLFHNQDDDYGELSYNREEEVPHDREGKLFAEGGIGDALWIAPNASYTDDYGQNKLAANIPLKYFMPWTEVGETTGKLYGRWQELTAKLKTKAHEYVKSNFPIKDATVTIQIDDLDKGLADLFKDVDIPVRDELYKKLANMGLAGRLQDIEGKSTFVDLDGNTYVLERITDTSKGTPDEVQYGLKLRPDLGREEVPWERLRDELVPKKNFLSKKEKSELDKIEEIITPQGNVRSFRALAEYTGKPVIDSTPFMNERGTSGTAYFYYRDVDPSFDEKIGEQLAVQKAGTQVWNDGLAEEMLDEWFGETTLEGLFTMIKDEYPNTADKVDFILESLKNKTAPRDPELESTVFSLSESLSREAAGLSALLRRVHNRMWTLNMPSDLGYVKDTTLADLQMSYARFYDATTAGELLEELGIENPDYITPEEKAAWEAIDPMQDYQTYTEQDLADIRLRDLERKRKILKKELKELCK